MTIETWALDTPGLLRLPSGLLVRGRGLRDSLPAGPKPEFGIYLQGKEPAEVDWESRWVRWKDFWLPSDPADFAEALRELLKRAKDERVEIACGGGFGRTGTAMSCLAILEGVPADKAVTYVREHYSHRAVETPWQKRFVTRFA
ncbi:Protein-tyrosine phosphatase [Actinokineospora alba]|uniref:Protein-tyrosine phosphatase n=1 Tax=Actinokineospora alba TaxID=504798 RepID=A0A1H0W1F3_9PSEU|nr:protein-tyrosine phosphatase [Actinokineospora alba]SDI71444.1 Protein-tyrosine phosphatase [Actinokineospora alba]SDP84522.1 Protein-tyrosine phosphatase [Actinokineospora alba]